MIKTLFLIPKCFSTLTNLHISIIQGGFVMTLAPWHDYYLGQRHPHIPDVGT